jgi:perosamine synthetase
MVAINKIAEKHGIAVIEDACEAIGASLNGRRVAGFSDCAVFAFYPNKQMTTGEGGMVVTDNEDIASMVKSMRNQGRDSGMGWLEHNRLGYNYRLSDINCALGIAQLSRLDGMLKKRSGVAAMYRKELSGIEGMTLPPEDRRGLKRSWFVYVVLLDHGFSKDERDEIIKRLRKCGIGSNNYFPPIHLQSFYADKFGYRRGDFPVTESVSDRTIALPFFNNLSSSDIKFVAGCLKKIMKEVAHD